MASRSFGGLGDGEGWVKSLLHPEPVAQERRIGVSRYEVIVCDATLCSKDHLKDPTVSRETKSSWISGLVLVGLTLTLTEPSSHIPSELVGGCAREDVRLSSFRKPS
jgi:hypothetical protein